MAHEERKTLPPAYKFIAAWLHPFMLVSVKRDFAGMEHFPRERGCVVAVNHNSHFDPLTTSLYLYDAGYPPFFLAKEALFRVPVVGKLLSGAGQIPVYRESGQAAGAYTAAVEGIARGKTIVIMPEGTLTRDPDLWPMVGKTGAARIAMHTRCPVVPLAQWGAHEVLPPYTKVLKLLPRKRIRALAGPPVPLSDLYDRPIDAATLREATERIMAAITELLEQVRGQNAPPERFDPRRAGVPLTGNPRKARS